ncbi:hypothetical protein X975_02240, partial [Stegodyphus mimosarum]
MIPTAPSSGLSPSCGHTRFVCREQVKPRVNVIRW